MLHSRHRRLCQPTHRRFWSLALVAALVISWVGTAAAQDSPKAEDLIGKYIKAVGKYTKDGKPATLKSRVTKGTLIVTDFGMEGEITNFLVPPNDYTKIVFEAFGEIERGVKGDLAWEINPMMGPVILEGGEKAARLQETAGFTRFENWKKSYSKAETTGEGTVGDAACYKVVMTPKEGSPVTCSFDKTSGLLLKTEVDVEGFDVEVTLSDYKETEGVKLPHKVLTEGGEYNLEMIIESVEYNVDIPTDRFDLPDEIKELTK